MNKKDGGPAYPAGFYPTSDTGPKPHPFSGMTLRDYFAAVALPKSIELVERELNEQIAADLAYRFAAAMLAAREAK